MPIALEQYGDDYEADNVVSIDQVFNIGSYSNSLLIVAVCFNNDQFETATVKWNGTTLNFKGSIAREDDSRVEIWYMTDPDQGEHTLECDFSQQLIRGAGVGWAVFSGVDQTTPLGTMASIAEDSGDGMDISITVTSETGDIIFAAAAEEDDAGDAAMDVGESGQVELWQHAAAGDNYTGAGSYRPSQGSTTVMTYDLGNDEHRAMAGVAIKPAAAAGGGQPMSLRGKQVPFLRSW